LNLQGGGQGNKSKYDFILGKSFKLTTIFDIMGELTCKLSFELGCPYGGNKGCTSKINLRENIA
jgi:hypothetical protein